jgi:catechol 2,3-dioxygenase-like lactoylglutathione lyase family enzyme
MSTPALEYHGLDHVQIAIPPGQDAAARAFYGGALGLQEVAVPASVAHLAALWYQLGPQRLHLGVEADFHPARKAHPALRIRGLEVLAQRLQAAGIPIKRFDPLEDNNRFFVNDPFGNRIEFLEPISSSGSPTAA